MNAKRRVLRRYYFGFLIFATFVEVGASLFVSFCFSGDINSGALAGHFTLVRG
jgi:hypothetical protein